MERGKDVEHVAVLQLGSGLPHLDADAGGRTRRGRRVGRREPRAQISQPFQPGCPDEVVLGAGVGFHHLHGGVRVAEVVGIDQDEVGRLVGQDRQTTEEAEEKGKE